MAQVILSIGCNLGSRANQISQMEKALSALLGNTQFSPLYKSAPVGVNREHTYYYNQIILGDWHGSPVALLDKTEGIERELGRTEKGLLTPRLADIDILLFEDEEIQTERLTIPHHALLERLFHIRGIQVVAPQWLVPTTKAYFIEYQIPQEIRQQQVEIIA